MSVVDRIRLLSKTELSTIELQTSLNTIHAQCPLSDPDSLLLCSVVLNRIVPQTYVLLDKPTRMVVYELLSSKVGISQLINAIQQDSEHRNTFFFIDILVNIVQHSLPHLIDQFYVTKGLGLETWNSILGVKIMDCLGMILIWLLDHPDVPEHLSADLDRSTIRVIMEQYAEKCTFYIVQSLERNKDQITNEKLQYIRQIVNSFLLKEPDQVLNVLLTNWKPCISLFSASELVGSKQKYLFAEAQKNFIVGVLHAMNFRLGESEMDVCHTWFELVNNLLKQVNFTDIRKIVFSHCERNTNTVVSFIWMRCLGNPGIEWVTSLINKFGNRDFILNTAVKLQTEYTKFLITTLTLLNDEQLQEISANISFMNSITSRLESKAATIMQLGMFVADYIYKRINGKFLFTVSTYACKREEFLKIFTQLDTQLQKVSSSRPVEAAIDELLNYSKAIKISDSTDTEVAVPMTPLMVEMDYDSDNEDSDLDDPSVERKPTVAKPVFLKDLLHYFTSDPQNDKTTYDKRGIAFSIGIEMVRIKKDTPEMKYYSTKLLDSALDLDGVGFPLKEDEIFDEDQIKVAFDSWRLSFMIAICTSEPDVIFKYLLENFIKQDWSVPTRIQVLTCIGLSCRELCGKEDKFIWGKTNLDKAAGKKLPGPGHDLFLNLDLGHGQDQTKKIVDIDQENRETQLVEAFESVGIGKGKVVRKSRKLAIDKKSRDSELAQGKTMHTSFINKKLPPLYYTLSAIWQEVNSQTYGAGFNVGTLSEYLNSHFLDILTMVYSCGVPSCIELVDMSIELIAVLSGQLQAIRTHAGDEFPRLLFKAVVNGIRLLLTDNERTLSVLRSTAMLEISMLTETLAHIVNESPPLEETEKTMTAMVLQQLQGYLYNI